MDGGRDRYRTCDLCRVNLGRPAHQPSRHSPLHHILAGGGDCWERGRGVLRGRVWSYVWQLSGTPTTGFYPGIGHWDDSRGPDGSLVRAGVTSPPKSGWSRSVSALMALNAAGGPVAEPPLRCQAPSPRRAKLSTCSVRLPLLPTANSTRVPSPPTLR